MALGFGPKKKKYGALCNLIKLLLISFQTRHEANERMAVALSIRNNRSVGRLVSQSVQLSEPFNQLRQILFTHNFQWAFWSFGVAFFAFQLILNFFSPSLKSADIQ